MPEQAPLRDDPAPEHPAVSTAVGGASPFGPGMRHATLMDEMPHILGIAPHDSPIVELDLGPMTDAAAPPATSAPLVAVPVVAVPLVSAHAAAVPALPNW